MLLASAVIAAQAGYTLMRSLLFVLYLSLGCLISEILGATIGIARASQTAAMGTAVPVMSVMSFLPLLATFNETVAKVAGFTYTERIKNLISGLSCDTMEAADLLVVFGSLAVALLLFTFIYKRNGLE